MTAKEYISQEKGRAINSVQDLKSVHIIGLDRSLSSTGISIIKNGKPIYGCQLKSKTYGAERLIDISKQLFDLIKQYKNPFIVTEDYSFNSRNSSSITGLAELGGVIYVFCELKKIPIIRCAPTLLKKYVLGNGLGKKDLMPMGILKKFKIEPMGGDHADAIGLGMLGYNAFNYKFGCSDYTKKDIECFDKLLSTEVVKKKRKKTTMGLENEI